MHVVIGFLTALVSLLWVLHRLAEMGIDLGGLNPWYWRRRRAWRKKYEGDPIFAVEDPMDVAALFVVGIAKMDGDISAEQKAVILTEFSTSFSLAEREASQLLGSSTHLLGHPQIIGNQLDGLMDRHKDLFKRDQAESLVAMMRNVVAAEQNPTAAQRSLLGDIERRFVPPAGEDATWAQGN